MRCICEDLGSKAGSLALPIHGPSTGESLSGPSCHLQDHLTPRCSVTLTFHGPDEGHECTVAASVTPPPHFHVGALHFPKPWPQERGPQFPLNEVAIWGGSRAPMATLCGPAIVHMSPSSLIPCCSSLPGFFFCLEREPLTRHPERKWKSGDFANHTPQVSFIFIFFYKKLCECMLLLRIMEFTLGS